MVNNPKYPPQELTEEDKEILDKAVLNYAIQLYALIEQYSNPKKYSEKVVLKLVKKNRIIAAVFTLAYAKNSPYGHQYRPRELNQRLSNDMQNAFLEQYKGLASQLQSNELNKKFLHPRTLREDVLKKLEDQGIFIHLTTKDEILRQQSEQSHSHRRSSSTKLFSERGGKLSVYILSKETERLKKAMEKTAAIDYLHQKLVKTGLAAKLITFQMLVFLYAAKKDRRVLDMAIGAGSAFFQEKENRDDDDLFFQRLQRLDDTELEKLVDCQINSIIEDKGFYAVLFFTGLSKL